MQGSSLTLLNWALFMTLTYTYGDDMEQQVGNQDNYDDQEIIVSEKQDWQNQQVEEDHIYYLSEKDFDQGPLRIMKSGTYVFTEDVVFDFGSYNDYPYYPDISQDDYPSAGECGGAWCMGYFAAITVETDDVTIDLGGYELKQSIEYYFQHRFFTHIELSNGQFLRGEDVDPVFINNFELRNGVLGRSSRFGIHGNYASNVIIKNVHIRDFATHGIQLNGWENIEMDNVEIGPSSQEEWLLDDYGHGRLMLPLLKALIDELNSHSPNPNPNHNDGGEEIINLPDRFNNFERGVTVEQVLDNLEYEMSLAYNYAINKHYERYNDNDYISPDLIQDARNDLHWKYAKEQFIWENGLPSTSSIHGIFLNTYPDSVYVESSTTKASHGAKLNNIRIHDLYHSYRENIGLAGAGITPWNTPWDARGAFGGDDNLLEYYNILLKNYKNQDKENFENDESWKDFEYIGNVLTDSYMTLYYFGQSLDFAGFKFLAMETNLYNFVLGIDDYGDEEQLAFNFVCNMDVMRQSGKGLLGLQMDAVYDVKISDVYLYNLYEHTPLGAIWCGEYEYEYEGNTVGKTDASAEHLGRIISQQTEFGENNLQGISIIGSYDIRFSDDIIISNLETDFGEIIGFSVWLNSDITIGEGSNMIVSNFKSGMLLTDDMIEKYNIKYESHPNKLPESCGIRLKNKDKNKGKDKDKDRSSDDSNSNSTAKYRMKDIDSKLTFENGIKSSYIITCGLTGYGYCLGDETNGNTLYGDYYDELTICNDILNSNANDGDDKIFLESLIVNKNNLIEIKHNVDFVAPMIILIVGLGVFGLCMMILVIRRDYMVNKKRKQKQKQKQTKFSSKHKTIHYGSTVV